MITLPKGWISVSIGGKRHAVQVARIASIERADDTGGEGKSLVRFGGPHESAWIVDEAPETLLAAIDIACDTPWVLCIDL